MLTICEQLEPMLYDYDYAHLGISVDMLSSHGTAT